MGLFNAIFGNKNKQDTEIQNYFQAFTAYTPVFTTYEGGLYEMELTRAIIHSFATACSKLKPELKGAASPHLKNTLEYRPNPFMSTSQFLYRVATILSVNNNAFIVPIENEYGEITGYYPLLPLNCEVMEISGVAYLRYTFQNGKRAAIEFEKVGLLTQHQYSDDFFGEDNKALKPLMQVLHSQNQSIISGVKNSATIRFLAKIAQTLKPEDITKERERFTASNLSAENKSGMIIYDGKYDDVKPIESKPLIMNAAQMKLITENAYNYFGMNEAIIQNKFNEDEFNAFYEGKIEPFAIQLSLAMSNMTYSNRELSFGNMIIFAADRLQYASNSTKIQLSTQLFDRSIINRNTVRDMWHLPPVEDGDDYFIRREYARVDKLHDDPDENPPIPAPEKPVGGDSDAKD